MFWQYKMRNPCKDTTVFIQHQIFFELIRSLSLYLLLKSSTFAQMKDIALYLYALLEGALERIEQSSAQSLLDVAEVYSLLLIELTKRENQSFPNSRARSVLVFDTWQVPAPLVAQLRQVERSVNNIARHHQPPSSEAFYFALKAVAELVHFVTQESIPERLIKSYADRIFTSPKQYSPTNPNAVLSLKVVVTEIGEVQQSNHFYVTATNEEYEKISIRLNTYYLYLQPILWKYANLSLTNIVQQKPTNDEDATTDSLNTFYCSPETLIAIDPDFLIDASSVAACQLRRAVNPFFYLLQKFMDGSSTNIHFVKGNIVNNYLDRYFMEQPATASELFDDIIQKTPFAALILTPADRSSLLKQVEAHFLTLHNDFLRAYKKHLLSLEPTFLSDIFGLRGRLDLLVAYRNPINRRDVVELKTSKDPKNFGKDIDEKDALQATCYNLLLDSAYPDRIGSSAILYSSAAPIDNPLRNAPNDIISKRNALKIRNYMVYIEYQLTQDPAAMLSFIAPSNFEKDGLWDNQLNEIKQFHHVLNRASDLEKNYFYEFVRFIAKEQRTAKVGSNNERSEGGFAALWNSNLAEKQKNYRLLSHLQFDELVKDSRGNLLLRFLKTPELTPEIATFRTGDFALLYPQEPDQSLLPTHHQVLRCTIKENAIDEIVLAPINPFLTEEYFKKYDLWAIEPELAEIGYDAMYANLYNFLRSSDHKRQLLLGLVAPRFDHYHQPIVAKGLMPRQNTLLNLAIAAKDYFLLQGPPGTGKTKVMLKELVVQLLKNPQERLLLLAYTNRAVDEMCEALELITTDKPYYIRLGHSETTTYKKQLLSAQVRDKDLLAIRRLIQDCRIVLATVLTYQRNPELHTELRFTTAIVDEASQLLEPQIIGVATHVDRLIMIGDEKQLPAVVIQQGTVDTPEKGVSVQSEALKSIGLSHLSNSMFERLLLQCQKNKWDFAYGMLEDQGRMHSDILYFTNKHYYNNQLKTIAEWQEQPAQFRHALVSNRRVVFLPSTAENRRNTNLAEAQLVANLVEQLHEELQDDFNAETIGIITPYRAQIAEIKRRIKPDLLPQISIDTVERYQGSQRKIIIISMAINSPAQLNNLHVLNSDGTVDKKLNVALTRAKELLIFVGCPAVLQKSPIYKTLLDYFATLKNSDEV